MSAGRGEGLADRLTESIWAISDGQHPDKDTLRNLIRNILAAAPAGTARRSKLELSIAEECLKPAIDLVNDAIWNYRETVTIKRGDLNYAVELAREALATPSPQAPTQDTQCFNCGACDIIKKQLVTVPLCPDCFRELEDVR